MEQQPHNPDDSHRRIPEAEHFDPAEIDLTGVIEQEDQLRTAVGDAVSEAETARGGLSERGARILARFLANQHEAEAGALHHYATTGQIDGTGATRELFDLYVAGDDERQHLVHVLGSHLMWRATQAEMDSNAAVADDNTPVRHGLLEPPSYFRLLLGTEAHGHAFIAYLELHDVDPHDDALLQGFRDAYLVSYSSMPELLQAFRAAVLDSELFGDRDQAILDDANLVRFAQLAWDIVNVGDKLHVFSK
jgi:hypothetical protein